VSTNTFASRRKSLKRVGPSQQLDSIAWSVPEADDLDVAIALTLHYRDRHSKARNQASRIEVCRCSRFEPAGDRFMRRLHAEIYSALRSGGLTELLKTLKTASGRPGLSPRKEAKGIAVA
jgi:hypothetical protein